MMGFNIRARSSIHLSRRQRSCQLRISSRIALVAALLTPGLKLMNTFPTDSSSPGSKGVAQIIEFLVGIGSSSIIILAIDDLRLGRMKLQAAFGKTSLKRVLQGFRLRLAAAMAEDVIGETLERDYWMMRDHPPIERIIEKEITQQG